MLRTVKAAPPPGDDALEYVMSDGSIDRAGDVIEPAGWQLENYRAHPIALFNHDRNQIIGEWTDVAVRGGRLTGRLKLAEAGTSPLVDMIRALVRQGIMRAVSVGFRALERQPLTKDADPYFGPFRFVRSELLECSLVSVPANPAALAIVKGYSRDLVGEVFSKPAHERYDQSTAVHSASLPKPLVRSGTITMQIQGGTLSQQIVATTTNLQALMERLKQLSEQETRTDEEETRADQLPDEIEATRALLDRLKKREKALAPAIEADASGRDSERQAQAERGVERIALPAIIGREREAREGADRERRPFAMAPSKKKIEPADYVFRALTAWSISQGTKDPIEKALFERYGNDEVTGLVLRAAVNPAMTTVAGWAAELVQTGNAEFLDRLIPNFIYPALASRGVRYTFGRNGQLKIPTRTTSQTVAGAWVGEGAPKPVRRVSLSSVTLTPHKLAVISTFTEEMAQYSTPAIEAIIRQAMQDDTGVSLDTYLIDNVAESSVRPAGLLNGVTPITASAATPAAAAMVADLKALVNALTAAGGGREIVILLNPSQALAIGFAQTTAGDFLFNDLAALGAKFDLSFVVSLTVPAGTVIAVDAADFATATGDTPRFAVSNEATLHEEDTSPAAIGSTGTPTVVAAPTRSLFQTDTIAIRMTLYVTWAMRRANMVQVVNSVIW